MGDGFGERTGHRALLSNCLSRRRRSLSLTEWLNSRLSSGIWHCHIWQFWHFWKSRGIKNFDFYLGIKLVLSLLNKLGFKSFCYLVFWHLLKTKSSFKTLQKPGNFVQKPGNFDRLCDSSWVELQSENKQRRKITQKICLQFGSQNRTTAHRNPPFFR